MNRKELKTFLLKFQSEAVIVTAIFGILKIKADLAQSDSAEYNAALSNISEMKDVVSEMKKWVPEVDNALYLLRTGYPMDLIHIPVEYLDELMVRSHKLVASIKQ